MAVSSSEECQSVDSVVVLPDGGTAKPEYESQQNIVRHMEDFNMMKSDVCLTTESNLENASLKMDKAKNYDACILDVDIEKGKLENPNPNDESVEHLKTNDSIARTLKRERSLLTGGKFMQPLLNHSSELPKFTSRDKFLTERVYDTLTNRSRRYKRSASFSSRRVVLLFSVLTTVVKEMYRLITTHLLKPQIVYLYLLVQVDHGNDNPNISDSADVADW